MFMQASKLSLPLAEGKCIVELLFVEPHIFRLRKLHKSKLFTFEMENFSFQLWKALESFNECRSRSNLMSE